MYHSNAININTICILLTIDILPYCINIYMYLIECILSQYQGAINLPAKMVLFLP